MHGADCGDFTKRKLGFQKDAAARYNLDIRIMNSTDPSDIDELIELPDYNNSLSSAARLSGSI